MPTYLLHGFRWHRQSIRLHVIFNDIDDASPEWLLAPATSRSIVNSFYTLYDFLPPSNSPATAYTRVPIPPIPVEGHKLDIEGHEAHKVKKSKSMISLRSRSMSRKSKRPSEPALPLSGNVSGETERKGSTTSRSDPRSSTTSASVHRQSLKSGKTPSFNDWSIIKLVEQYDPSDVVSLSQPFAYVADYMIEVSLGVAIADEIAKYEMKMNADNGCVNDRTEASATPAALGKSSTISIESTKEMERPSGWFEKLRNKLQSGEEIGWYVVVCGDEERASPSMETMRRGVRKEDDGYLRTPRGTGLRSFFRKRSIHD